MSSRSSVLSARNLRGRSRWLALLAGLPLGAIVLALGAAVARGDDPRKTVRLPHPDSGPPPPAANAPGLGDAGFVYTRTPPDPQPPLSSARQWVFDLRYHEGDIFLVDTRGLDLPEPRETPRVMGRFALELYDRTVLVERVRFDFPFLGAPAVRPRGPIALDRHVTSSIGVVFPRTPRGTRLELVDRSTDERWQLPWPAKEQFYIDVGGGAPASGKAR